MSARVGAYCGRSICVELKSATNGTPGTARFFIEGVFGAPCDLKTSTRGSYCVEKHGIGFVAFTVLVAPASEDLFVTVADDVSR